MESDLPLTVELHQRVIRADGTVEELGCVASSETGTAQVNMNWLERYLNRKSRKEN
jgi:hypothetical protein